MKNEKKIILLVLALVIVGVVIYVFKSNKEVAFDNEKAINVVKMYISAENEHNIEKAKSYMLNTNDNANFQALENEINSIKTIKFVSAEKAKVEYKPESYTMSDGKKLDIKQGVVLDVTYEVDYKNNNQPDSSGKNSMLFTVVKLDDGYKIVNIGTGP